MMKHWTLNKSISQPAEMTQAKRHHQAQSARSESNLEAWVKIRVVSEAKTSRHQLCGMDVCGGEPRDNAELPQASQPEPCWKDLKSSPPSSQKGPKLWDVQYFYQTKKRNIPNEVALLRKEIHMDRKASLPPSAASQPLSFIHKPRAAALKTSHEKTIA